MGIPAARITPGVSADDNETTAEILKIAILRTDSEKQNEVLMLPPAPDKNGIGLIEG